MPALSLQNINLLGPFKKYVRPKLQVFDHPLPPIRSLVHTISIFYTPSSNQRSDDSK